MTRHNVPFGILRKRHTHGFPAESVLVRSFGTEHNIHLGKSVAEYPGTTGSRPNGSDRPIGQGRSPVYARRMRRSLWSMAVFGLAVSALAVVGGTAIGGDLGPMTVGYGLLTGLAALYALAGLAIRERAWRRLPRPSDRVSRVETVASHRVF